MAIITFNTERFKTKQGFGRVTGIAIGSYMRADKGKTAELMDLCNIFNDPGFRRMAPSAFKSHCLVMNISVAGHAVGFCISKNKRFVARSAINLPMLADKLKLCLVMIKGEFIKVYFPTFSGMAITAINLKIFAVGRLREYIAAQYN
jgi:hypothetical protein